MSEIQKTGEPAQKVWRTLTALQAQRWIWLVTTMSAMQKRILRKAQRPEERLRVLDRLQLGGKKSLLVVGWEEQNFLVALGSENTPQVTHLGNRPQTDRSDVGFARLNRAAARKRVQGRAAK